MANVVRSLVSRGPFTVLSSAARTAAPDTQEFEAFGVDYRGLHLIIDVTSVTLTPSVTVTIAGVDRLSGKTYPATTGVLQSAAITAVGTTVLKIGPALTAAANSVANDFLPTIFRVSVSHLDADSITYSIAGQLCP